MLNNICYLCLSVNKRTSNIYKTHLQHVYESLAHYKISDNECWMCYICHTRLQQCQRLQQLAVLTRGLIHDLGQNKNEIEFGWFKPLLELSIYQMKNINITHPTACNIKQELDVNTEMSNEGVTEEDESVKTPHDYEENEQSSIKLEQDISSSDSWRRSRMPELILVRLSQSVIDKYVRQSPPTHTAVDKYLEDKGKCTGKPSVESEDMKHNIEEEVGDTGIEKYVDQETAIVREAQIEHIRTHTDEKPFSCDICKKNFTHKGNFNKHLRVHTGEKPFSCDICKKNFTRKGNLNVHSRVHTADKPFSCDTCQKSFTSKSTLKTHLRIHTGDKPFNCHFCQMSFTSKGNMKTHFLIHTGEKQFKCHLCQKLFAYKSSLNKHIRTHTGEKPFNCHLCQGSFTEKSSLINHIRIHTGEKPFTCDICSKSFTQQSNFRVHIQIHARQK